MTALAQFSKRLCAKRNVLVWRSWPGGKARLYYVWRSDWEELATTGAPTLEGAILKFNAEATRRRKS